jgi:hypothetical protein
MPFEQIVIKTSEEIITWMMTKVITELSPKLVF